MRCRSRRDKNLISHRELYSASRSFAHSDDRIAWSELCVTLALYFGAMALGLATLGTWWITIPMVLITAAMAVRTYMIQHDCLHRSFFTSRQLNDRIGTLISPVAMTPYEATRYLHGQHHTYVGDLDRREAFEIYVMTLKEWQMAPWWKRLQYRIYRSPVVLILIGPFLFYAVFRRLPLRGLKTGAGDLILHNSLIAAWLGLIWWTAGWGGIAFWAASVYVGATFGALIPYIVHNFEDIHWGRRPDLTFSVGALEGSAVLDWGRLFDLVTMNIGYHDLHHFNAKIPGYKLREAHATLEARGLLTSRKIGFLHGLTCLRWKLYDEDNERMIVFPNARRPLSIPAE